MPPFCSFALALEIGCKKQILSHRRKCLLTFIYAQIWKQAAIHTQKTNEYLDSERIEEKGGYNLSWFCGRNVYSWVKEEKKPNVKISAMQTVLG